MGLTTRGHIAAILTMSVWGTTFIVTKILLRSFAPVEILITRFVVAFVFLSIISPRRMEIKDKKHELYFIGAGLSGICLYYLLENIALTFTMASNVGVILAVAPFFTGLAVYFFMREGERLTVGFFLGFVVAIIGIAMISFNGTKLQLNPIGDMLAVLAAMVWAVYSMCTRKVANLGYATIPATKRIFGYGILWMIPALFVFDFDMNFAALLEPTNIFCLAFLGLGASAICFVSWNYALKLIGIVASSVYIYIGPVITVVAAAIILHEPITMMMAIGTVLTLTGMVISEFVKIKEIG